MPVLGIRCARKRDFVGGGIDVTEVAGREFDGHCSEVFAQARRLRRAGNRHDPRLAPAAPQARLGQRVLTEQINFTAFCFYAPLARRSSNGVGFIPFFPALIP